MCNYYYNQDIDHFQYTKIPLCPFTINPSPPPQPGPREQLIDLAPPCLPPRSEVNITVPSAWWLRVKLIVMSDVRGEGLLTGDWVQSQAHLECQASLFCHQLLWSLGPPAHLHSTSSLSPGEQVASSTSKA